MRRNYFRMYGRPVIQQSFGYSQLVKTYLNYFKLFSNCICIFLPFGQPYYRKKMPFILDNKSLVIVPDLICFTLQDLEIIFSKKEIK